MAQVKFLTGQHSNLPSDLTPGNLYFSVVDENKKIGSIIFDKDSTSRYIMSVVPETNVAYATCETSGNVWEKEIIINYNSQWQLSAGSSLFIKFNETNLVASPSFTIWDRDKSKKLGEKIDVYFESEKIKNSSINRAGQENRIIHYVYDGKVFHFMGWSQDNEMNYNVAKYSQTGLIKPWYNHTVPSIGPTEGSDSNQIEVNEITSVKGRYYALEMDSEGRGFVNVPWEKGSGSGTDISDLKSLNIGPYSYNGSEEITIPIFNGNFDTN